MTPSAASVTANWSFPTAVRFGCGRIGALAGAVRELGAQNPLVVTDAGHMIVTLAQPDSAEVQ